jgi:hypothetical protein
MCLDFPLNTSGPLDAALFADDQAVTAKSDDLQLALQILKSVRTTILKFILLKMFQYHQHLRL